MQISPGLSRAALGASLILAPLFLLAAGLSDPTTSADDERALLAAARDSSQALAATQLFYILAGLALIPAAFALMRLTSDAPRLALLAAGALAAGGLSLVALEASAFYLSKLATSDVPLAQQVSVVTAVENSTGVVLVTIIHVVGLLGGMLLAAIGLFHTHAVARWVPVAIVVGLLGSLATTDDTFIAAAGAVLLAGLGSAAVRLLGTSTRQPHGRAFASATAG